MQIYDSTIPYSIPASIPRVPRVYTVPGIWGDSADPADVNREYIEQRAVEAIAAKCNHLCLDCEQLGFVDPATGDFRYDLTRPHDRRVLNCLRLVSTYARQSAARHGLKWGFYGCGYPLTGRLTSDPESARELHRQLELFKQIMPAMNPDFLGMCAYVNHGNLDDNGELLFHELQYMNQLCLPLNKPQLTYVCPVYAVGDPAWIGVYVEPEFWRTLIGQISNMPNVGVVLWGWGISSGQQDGSWDPSCDNVQYLRTLAGPTP